MDVTPLVGDGVQIIHGYSESGFRIADVVIAGPVLVSHDQTLPWSLDEEALNWTELDVESFRPLFEIDSSLDVLLIGTGARQAFIPHRIRDQIRAMGPVAEIMDTGAACRTFNVLLAEGRRVAAALVPAR